MRNFIKDVCLFLSVITLFACKNNKQQYFVEDASAPVGYENEDVHAVQQALPTIMVIPSDKLLENYDALKFSTADGKNSVIRNYGKYLLANSDNTAIVATIQDLFLNQRFSLNDLEQSLKQLDTREATDAADGIGKDAKTLLITSVMPDIIIELDYDNKLDLASHNVTSRKGSMTLRAIDAYTNKIVASVNVTDLEGDNMVTLISKALNSKFSGFSENIQKYFSDILYRGREVTVRITVERNSNITLTDVNIEGDTYADWVIDYIKVKSVKGAYKMERNTEYELYFNNVRIPLLNEDGTQYGVYDWTRDFCKNIRKNLGVSAVNRSQGLGEIMVTIKGL